MFHSGRLRPYLQTLDYAGKACQRQTLADYENLIITAVKSFIGLATRAYKINLFTAEINPVLCCS